jgi:hypothetical protein
MKLKYKKLFLIDKCYKSIKNNITSLTIRKNL